MKLALIVPGGVDRSAEYRVIPALLALIKRLSRVHEVHVFALRQEARPARWQLCGATIHNIGFRFTVMRAVRTIAAEHRIAPFQILQALWSGEPGFVGVLSGRLLRLPCALHVAGGELVALADIGYGGRRSWQGRWREAAVLRGAAAVTAASAPMLEALAALGITAARLPLGIDLEAWPPREPRHRNPNEPLRLVHVASLNRVKDQATLLRAVSQLADRGVELQLDLIGEDTLCGEMQALAARLKLGSRARFQGFMTQKQAHPLVAAAHLSIVSSRHEAGPVALLEAAAVGVPTVGTQVGHIAEWAPTAAVSVPVADPDALCAAISRLSADEDLRMQLARCAYERAMRQDADYTARAFESLHAALLNRNAETSGK